MRRRLLLSLLVIAGCSRSSAAPAPPSSAAPAATPVSPPSAAAPAPTGPAIALQKRALADAQAYATVRSLVDAAGPRLSGSPGSKAAVPWALGAMKTAGLADVHAEPVMVPRWERGRESGAITSPSHHPLALAALGGSVGTGDKPLEAEVILATSLDAVDALDPAKVKGKIVFFDVPMERRKDGSGYGKAVGVRGHGASRAAKLGAAGVVIRSIGTDHARTPHTGHMRYDEDKPKIPAAALSIPDAEVLRRLLDAGETVRLSMTLGAKALPDVEGANVIGDIPGRDPKGGIVLLGAHLDSWDLGHGAIDDGAGCGIVLDAARQIAHVEPRPLRTVRVVLFANEENGLRGADGYAKAHAAEIDRHVLALEADFGAARVFESRFRGGAEGHAPFLALSALLGPLGVEPSEGEAEGGADLIPLMEAGVPVMDLRQDGTNYFDIHHTANDTVEQIVPEEIAQVSAAYATVAYAAASGTDSFGKTPEDKRKIR
ncbi:MAG: M28 family peptidase [Byssovorax sp.]